MKYGNNLTANAYDHAHAAIVKLCEMCTAEGTFGHHFSRMSEDKCYYLCAAHEYEYFGEQ